MQKISDTAIRAAVIGGVPNPSYIHIYVGDEFWSAPTYQELKDVFLIPYLNQYPYTPRWDCNSFALVTAGFICQEFHYRTAWMPSGKWEYRLAFGQVWGNFGGRGNHAKNCCVTEDRGLVYLEPQNEKIELIESVWNEVVGDKVVISDAAPDNPWFCLFA